LVRWAPLLAEVSTAITGISFFPESARAFVTAPVPK